LSQADTDTVPAVERLRLILGMPRKVEDPAVGEHPVHVEEQEANPERALACLAG